MAIYVNENNKITDVFINPDSEKRIVKSIWCNKDEVATKVFSSEKPSVKIVTWADGTDEEIQAMLNAHYNSEIDIHDYWHVGDERTVNLGNITEYYNNGTGYVSENNPSQTVTFVLMHSGGFKLKSSINDKIQCAFVVGQKNALLTPGKLHQTAFKAYWNNHRTYWCNNVYNKSLPTIFSSLFKKVMRYGACYEGNSQAIFQNDAFYFDLPSEYNIFGKIINSCNLEKNYQFQFDYYKNSENICKKLGDNGAINEYWTCSVSYNSQKETFGSCTVTSNGISSYRAETKSYGIAPYGCI